MQTLQKRGAGAGAGARVAAYVGSPLAWLLTCVIRAALENVLRNCARVLVRRKVAGTMLARKGACSEVLGHGPPFEEDDSDEGDADTAAIRCDCRCWSRCVLCCAVTTALDAEVTLVACACRKLARMQTVMWVWVQVRVQTRQSVGQVAGRSVWHAQATRLRSLHFL